MERLDFLLICAEATSHRKSASRMVLHAASQVFLASRLELRRRNRLTMRYTAEHDPKTAAASIHYHATISQSMLSEAGC